ncbi:hypothetical protein [Pseudanabaena sp. FACHB-2040]|uniref:hypothetical protein n=1 Tax=Pseudanabaena sp. FACHB-2040 TaxID=2692859 RepID=UPI001685E138|nr:hypothetical protein [Pseudanabaena sp. FACHB-2040]MBD2261090.1 hypothetical protein [Pseudanabaena sp. FACHB-2040]
MSISLHRFCKTHDLPKASVHRRAQTLGLDTSDGLDDAAQAKLLKEFGRVVTPQVTVEEGNHCSAMSLQVGCARSNLEQFRTDRIRQALANPQEFITSLTGFLDQLEEGMGQAEAHQEQELLQVHQLKRQSQKRIEQFRRRADEYRIKTDLLASIQNAELDDLQVLAEETNALGKPAVPGQG